MKNKEIADIFYRIADILELKNERFKPRAYRNAASTVESISADIEGIYRAGKLRELKGIGKAIAKKIAEYIETDGLEYLDQLQEEMPPDLIQMLNIPTLGPKKIMSLHKHLGIETVEDLERAVGERKIQELDGFGEISQRNIGEGLKVFAQARDRMLLGDAFPKATAYVEYLRKDCGRLIEGISVTGSLRRMSGTIGDIDILIAPRVADREAVSGVEREVEEDGKGEGNEEKRKEGNEEKSENGMEAEIAREIMEVFTSYRRVKEVIAKGDTKSSVRFKDNTQVDVRVISPESWGAALQYFTGSKEHNIEVRRVAIEKGLKINEYGVFDRETDRKLAGDDEEEVYSVLGLAYVPPETRENRGEVELALEGELPELVVLEDVRGDLHTHTELSDGIMPASQLIELAVARGYDFLGITDHSPSLSVTRAPTAEEKLEQVREIRRLDNEYDEIKIFAGSEVDINDAGGLDYPDHVLEELDLVVGAVHSSFSMERKRMTRRIIDAFSTGYMNIFAHPTGRKIGQREPYALDIDKVMDEAIGQEVALEINSMPVRLDLKMDHVILAEEKGALLSVNTDSHRPHHMDNMRYGVGTARKGRARRENIINTWPVGKLEKFLLG